MCEFCSEEMRCEYCGTCFSLDDYRKAIKDEYGFIYCSEKCKKLDEQLDKELRKDKDV